ncbi:23S rRNA (uracil(1939)-C(5))-methyltransferase RlmD [Lapidilactobacillus wuchangensis]|uniref:23S rRNA (uracil(1939)-C(5))-methyltransferase RlmD n=1 Tax=Lapidilactobacillus wuchangensis TaxID=2486001 RepID=UPI000F77AF0B|nr:23S rRNA (uracil(1939)-C(5))-methyltransferase RlmD [Lapidilactobacillus wuchangensis]
MTESVNVTIGQRFPITARRIGINGEGIGYFQHKVTFVPGLIPGEVAVCEATKVTDRYIEAKIHHLRKTSPNRVKDLPPLAGKVGGLELAHIAYPQQLIFKNDLIKQALEKFKPRGYQHYEIMPPLGMTAPWHYRNKAQFPIRQLADGKLICGLYRPGTQELVDLPTMPTQSELTLKVCRGILPILKELAIPIYDPEQNSGIIKAIAVRESRLHQQVQLTFITNSKKMPQKRALLAAILQQLPEVVSVSQNFNPAKDGLFWGDETWLLAGEPYLEEQLGKRRFLLSPRAFLQLNLSQTEKMYQIVRDYLQLTPNDVLMDAYAGVGTIGISLADQVKQVVGIEEIPEAVADAEQNVQHNHLTNVSYRLGQVETIWPELVAAGTHFTALVVDPPRTGLAPSLVEAILQAAPKKFVYISCNESTLARDLVSLTKAYQVTKMQMVDLFPQTARVETVVKLERRASTH